jgi:hypothetical protein
MKLAICLVICASVGLASAEKVQSTPMAQAVQLIEELEKQTKSDGKQEQEDFDAYACWCEKTM